MRRLLLSLLIFSFAICFTVAGAKQSYFPHQGGLRWVYNNGESQVLSGPKTFQGKSVMVLTHYLGGAPVSEDYLQYQEGGVFTLGTAAGGKTLHYTPPLILYQGAALKAGQSWQSTAHLSDFDITLSAQVLGVVGVQTPAGRFNALHLRQQTVTSTGAQTSLDLFFVPGVGIVRFITQDGTRIDLLEKNF
jgi:hypothetical protein